MYVYICIIMNKCKLPKESNKARTILQLYEFVLLAVEILPSNMAVKWCLQRSTATS